MRTFYILMFLIIGFNIYTAKSDTFFLNDTTLTMGQSYKIPIYGVVSDSGAISLKILYSAMDFDIKDIFCSDSTAISCISKKDILLNDFRNSQVIIKGVTGNLESRVLCYLTIEPLVSPRKECIIETSEMKIEGKIPENFQSWKAVINLEEPFIPRDETYISQARPNPFRESLEFNIGLIEDTKVSFYIYSAGAELIQRIPGDQEAFDFSINSPDGLDGVLSKGNYTLKLNPNRNYVPLGLYVIFMDTGRKIYKSNFIFMK